MRLHGAGGNRKDTAETQQKLDNSRAETQRLRAELNALRAAHAAVTAGNSNGHGRPSQPVS